MTLILLFVGFGEFRSSIRVPDITSLGFRRNFLKFTLNTYSTSIVNNNNVNNVDYQLFL